MEISLTPELEHAVRARVESGLYGDASEVLREALRCLLSREQKESAAMAWPEMGKPWTPEALRAAVALGARQAERGEFVNQTMEEIFAEWEKDNPHAN